MSSAYDKDYSTLNWIKAQVDQRLEQARFKLEEAEAGSDAKNDLADCASYLHEVRGSLRMVELYGPTMVVEEMESLVSALAEEKVEDRDAAYSAVMRGLVQLPDYLDRIQSGHRDVPTALLPLLNEVRSAGGKADLDEAHVFSPRLSTPVPEKYQGAPRKIKLDQQKAAAAKLRLAFQSSLANWMRGEGNPDAQLKRMMKVVETLRKASAEPSMWRMLWALDGVLEALLVDGLDANQEVRAAMREVDRELKRFSLGGDPEIKRRPPDDLTRALLYHVTVCKATSPRVTQLRETYDLVGLLPRPEELAHAEGAMAGRNRELLDTVSSAIREDIYRIKDALDVFIGDDNPEPSSLASLSERLDSVADTLGMLGMNGPRQRVLDQAQVLNDIVNGQIEADEDALMGIAGNLLRVEGALDDHQTSLGGDEEPESDEDAAGNQPMPSEVRRVVGSLMGEALTNLTRAKSALNDYVNNPAEQSTVEKVPEMLTDIAGAMRMVRLDTLGDASMRVSAFVERIKEFGPQPEFMDTLADALSVIEMYMEGVRDQQPGRSRLSEQLTATLEKLAKIEASLEDEATPQTDAQAETQASAEPVAEPAEPVVDESPAQQPESEQPQATEPAAEEPATVAPGIEFAEDIDDDIREVFVEEVEEELAKVRELYPVWRNDNDDDEALTTLRRCFHTLKGSGRLVGARSIGEFAWSIENLYNRLIDNAVKTNDDVFKVLDDAVDALEQLYGQLRDGSPVTADVAHIEACAFALADGKPLPEPVSASSTGDIVGEDATAAPAAAAEGTTVAEEAQAETELDLEPGDQLPSDSADWALADDDSSADADSADAIDAEQLLADESASDSNDAVPAVDGFDSDAEQMDTLLRGWDEEPAEEPVGAVDDNLATEESDDQQLMAIFEKEARGHVESIRDYLDRCDKAGRTLAIDVDLLRATHTLNGAACMARVEAVSESAGVLEGYIKGLSQEKKRPSDEGLTTFAAAVSHYGEVLDRIAAGETDLAPDKALNDRARALLEELSDPSLTKASMTEILEAGKLDEPIDDGLDMVLDDEDAEGLAADIEDSAEASDAEHAIDDDAAASLELTLEDDTADAPSTAAAESEADVEAASSDNEADATLDEQAPVEDEAEVGLEFNFEDVADETPDASAEAEHEAADSDHASDATLDDMVAEYSAENDAETGPPESSDESALDDFISGWDESAEDADGPMEIDLDSSEASAEDGEWSLDEDSEDLASFSFDDEQGDDAKATEGEELSVEDSTELAEDASEFSWGAEEVGLDGASEEPVEAGSSDVAEAEEDSASLVENIEAPESGDAEQTEVLESADEVEEAEAVDALSEALPGSSEAIEAEAGEGLDRLLDDSPVEADDSTALADPADAEDVEPWLHEEVSSEAEPASSPEASVSEETTSADDKGSEDHRPWEADEELLEVFLEEGAEILDSLDEQVAQLRDGNASNDVLAALQRELHTLKGSARMASVNPVGDLAHRLESLLENCGHGRRDVDKTVVSATEAVLDHLHNAIGAVKDGGALPDTQGVDAQLGEALGEAPDETPAVDTSEAEAPTTEAPPSVASEDKLVPLADDADAELVEIFMQEAREILDTADGLAEKLRHSAGAPEPSVLEDLQRELHTLKGGARMAGVEPIGDLGHNLESLLEKVTGGRGEANAELLSLVMRVLDQLNRQLTALEAGESMPSGAALNAEIDAVLSGKPMVADATPEAEPAVSEERPSEDVVELEDPAEAASAEPLEDAESSDELVAKTGGLLDFGPISSVSAISGANIIPLTRGGGARTGGKQRKESTEMVRVRSSLLDNLVNYAGEVSIYRSRLEQQMSTFRFNLVEFDQTVSRLREQLRKMEIETETQILSRHQREQETASPDFDPLEMDRYSQLQLLSRSLSESLSDLVSIQDLLEDLTRESETLLLQQSRVSGELQEGLMRTRMVPFSNLVPRLRRIIRQTTAELGKQARLVVEGAEGEMDRTVLEKLTPPLEHMLRNALDHGLETPDQRSKAGKPEEGTITISVSREASEVVLRIRDDGAGINLDRVRQRAIERGLMAEDAELGERDIMRFIMEAGFSTAETVTKLSGRGVGMDVVNSEIKQLNGTLDIDSELGQGTHFTVRLPFTLSVSQAIMIKLADEEYAVPLSSIEGVYRMPRDEFESTIQDPDGKVQYAGAEYSVYDLGLLLGRDSMEPPEESNVPLLMIRTGDQYAAVRVERLMGSREIVIKSVGPQLSSIPGVTGATVLGDGSVVLILDLAPLARKAAALHRAQPELADEQVAEFDTEESRQLRIMVVDDSITMRKVATRMLERHDFEVHTAKDGVDAVAALHDLVPDLMLLDIEMPRMDGYELATHVRNTSRLKHVPIIMITSRTGQKHRQRAFDIGVDRYLGKPYQEAELLATINELLGREITEIE
jgi:chemosensory pili system protein ChpA (sensor histidine kinase/response regulator)